MDKLNQVQVAEQVKSVAPNMSARRQAIATALILGVCAMTGAHAEGGVDVSTIVTMITGFVATVSAVGLAVLSLFVTAKMFKWIKTAI